MSISEEKIQEVRDATDIVAVVSQHVTLKKRGKTYVGLCPFHNEKTPSFHVDPVRGFYHCFGCNAGGNVFTFVMQMERIGFPEAVRLLAEKARITLPEYTRDDNRTKEVEALYHANQMASDFFRNVFLQSEEGKQAQTYLFSRRKFDSAIAETFKIGMAPNRWDGLIKKAESVSMPLDALLKAGLIIPRKDGRGYYDRFRGRLMFPIHNPSGKVVGFGGRIIKEDPNSPKYLNSPETPVYQKSRILYGLYQSIAGIQRENKIVLVEGYTDLMRMVMCGFDFAVATSGTALTEGHAALLSRYTKHAVLVFDGDSAGFNAALRGVDILVEAGLSVQVAPLPKGTDPDTFLLQYGKMAMDKQIHSAKQFIDFFIDQQRDKNKLETITGRAETARSILSVISKVKDPIERNLLVKQTGEKLHLDEDLLLRELPSKSLDATTDELGSVQPISKGLSARLAAEEGVLYLLLEDGLKWTKAILNFLNLDHFKNERIRNLVANILDVVNQGKTLSQQEIIDQNRSKPEIIQYLTGLFSRDNDKETNSSQYGLDCIIRLRQEEIQERIDRIRQEIQTLQREGKGVSGLIREYQTQKQKLDKLKGQITADWKKQVENV